MNSKFSWARSQGQINGKFGLAYNLFTTLIGLSGNSDTFQGSIPYLAKCLHCHIRTVYRNLNKLESFGVIERIPTYRYKKIRGRNIYRFLIPPEWRNSNKNHSDRLSSHSIKSEERKEKIAKFGPMEEAIKAGMALLIPGGYLWNIVKEELEL